MDPSEPTLCFPDGQKSCFACCPPIRPAGYEHIQFQKPVDRMLRENTACYNPGGRNIKPIVGFSCWALGYTDPGYRQAGCLLHPARNQGVDLRYRVGYGEKCRRETCLEARTFLALDVPARIFWLQLSAGHDSFGYSSRRRNPLFRLMGWGAELLGRIASEGVGGALEEEDLLRTYPLLGSDFSARALAYPVTGVVRHRGLAPLRDQTFPIRFEKFSSKLAKTLKNACGRDSYDMATHRLPLGGPFLDFLRLFLGMDRMSEEDATRAKEIVDEAVERFSREHW